MRHEPVHQSFTHNAVNRPDDIAISFGGSSLSYSELLTRSNQISNLLLSAGADRGWPVAILCALPPDIITSIIGVLKAGCAFVPVDTQLPPNKLSAMFAVVDPPLIIADHAHLELARRLGQTAGSHLVCFEDHLDQPDTDPQTQTQPDQLSYIYFTSGSTGVPKAIAGRLKGIDHFINWEIEHLGLEPGVKVSHLLSPVFDGSLRDIFVPLLAGGEICVPHSREVAADGQRMSRWLSEAGVEVAHLVPTMMREMLNSGLSGVKLDKLKHILLAGEPLSPKDVGRWMEEVGDGVRLWNLYGTSETTMAKFYYEVKKEDAARKIIPIGKPMPGAAAIVVTDKGKPCPQGMIGEIYIRTAYRSLGYYKQEEQTKEVFIKNPFSQDEQDIVYKTGDMGRVLKDGNYECLGRRDSQVKIRGVRVELGEVEEAIRRCAGVRDVAVIDQQRGAEKYLCAYVVMDQGARAKQVREEVAEELSEVMRPSRYVEMEELPRTISGKVDRRGLPEAGEGGVSEEYVEARSGIEEVIAGIWKEVLGVGRVGVHDNFFELGGHSLRATQVLGRIRGVMGVEISLKELFRRPTVEGLGEEVERRLAGGERREESKIEKVNREGEVPLSFAQHRFWIIQQLTPGSAAFNLPTNLSLKGELRKEALDAALSSVIARHEVLRTSFPVVNHNPVQRIHPAEHFNLPLVDLSLLDAEPRSREVQRLAREEARRPFDLTKGPMIRGLLIKEQEQEQKQEQEHALLFTLHHIVSDGWSVGVVVREISRVYEAHVRGEEVEAEELEIQYADYAVWQREWLAGQELERQMSYWKEQLAGAPAFLDLPLDRPRPAVQTYSGARKVFMLPVDTHESLRGLARRERVTTFMVLLTAFKILLHRYSGQQDVIVGTPVAGRNRVEIENLIGCFVNSLALRTDFTGDPTFSELLAQVRANSLEAFAHQDLPFEKIVEELQPARILSHTPLFQVLMALQNAPRETLKLSGLTFALNPVETGTTKYDLTLVFHEAGGAIAGVWEYNTDLFDEVTIARMAKHFTKLMEAIAATPELPVSSLPLLDEDDRQQVLFAWNQTEAAYPNDATIDQLIESQAKMRPDAHAAVCGNNELSYGDLDHQSNLVAGYLKSLGIGRGSRVGVYLDHSLVLLPALLGILKSGAAYVPLDTNHPLSRLEFIVKDAGIEYVLTEEAFSERLSTLGVQKINLDSQWTTIASSGENHSDSTRSPQDLAYIIYTSGSTGRPKGVMITHQSLVNYIWWAGQAYLHDESHSFALYSSLAFDLTVTSIFTPLITGNSIVMYDRRFDLTAMLEDSKVSVVKLTPSHLSLITDLDHSSVRKLIVGGEAFGSVTAKKLFDSFGGQVEIYNEYGPTEATVGCMIYRYDPQRADRADVPIGRPAANTRIYVLDKSLEPVPENVAGELYISGDGLALGYLDNPVLTAEKFIPNPFAESRRMYKSGDLARRLNDGEIEFIGRRDEQIKFHGHRVELNEIRNAINGYPGVEKSAVMLINDEQGSEFMVAYYVSPKELDKRELRDYLKTQIMEEIIPGFYVRLDQMPLTVNGKIDHAALPSFKETQNVRELDQNEERTPVEELVAGIWQEILGIEQLGLDEDFFELGGHSLLATQVVSRVKAAFGVSIGLRSIFKASTVRKMAKRVEECLRKGEQDEAPPIVRVPRDGALPLSFAQHRLWLISQLDEGGAAYNAFTGLRLKGELRKEALEAALSSVIARHEVLRTSFPVVNHNPVQLIHPAQPFHLPFVDLSLLDAESRSREVQRVAGEEVRRPFDLTKGPLIRGLLIKEQKQEQKQEQEHALLFTLHHIVSDGWSVGVVVREVSRVYEAHVRGEEVEAEELEIQYADYAVWQREWLAGEELERQMSYWKEQLAGAPAFLDLPLDKPRSSLTEYKGAAKAFMVPADVLTALKALSRKEQVTLFMTLLAAFDILLMRYTGQDDIVVGSNIANRNRKEIEGLIGFFVNNLVLRTDLSGDPTFSDLLHRVREVCLGAYTHQDLPFELVVEAVQPQREMQSTPLFQVMFVLQNAPSEVLQLPGLTVAPLPVKGGTARFDLMMNLRETPQGLYGALEFSTDIFYPETIENMVEQFSTLLADIATDPDREISLLSVIRDEETERLGDRFYQDVLAAQGSL